VLKPSSTLTGTLPTGQRPFALLWFPLLVLSIVMIAGKYCYQVNRLTLIYWIATRMELSAVFFLLALTGPLVLRGHCKLGVVG
jgi:hypothetical protein